MGRWAVVLIAGGAALACAGGAPEPETSSAPAGSTEGSAEVVAVVESVYQAYEDPLAVDPWVRFASAGLARSWRRAAARAKDWDGCGTPPIRELDPILDALDARRVSGLTVTAQVDGDKATATARFERLGEPTEVGFTLVREDALWRIDDVDPSGPTLQQRIRVTLEAPEGC